jgi:hypothetical protein
MKTNGEQGHSCIAANYCRVEEVESQYDRFAGNRWVKNAPEKTRADDISSGHLVLFDCSYTCHGGLPKRIKESLYASFAVIFLQSIQTQ